MNSRSKAISTWGVCRAISSLLSSEVNLISRGNAGSIEPVGDLPGPVGTTESVLYLPGIRASYARRTRH